MSSKQPETTRPVDHGWVSPPTRAKDEDSVVSPEDAPPEEATATEADVPPPGKGSPRQDPTKRPVDHGW